MDANRMDHRDLHVQKGNTHFWIKILTKVSTKGVNINNITFTAPSCTTYYDACEFGMGGFNYQGLVWRYTYVPCGFIIN